MDLGRRLRMKRAFGTQSERDTDAEGSETSGSGDGYFCSPGPFPARQPWLASPFVQNSQLKSTNGAITINSTASPWLSAIPRSTGTCALKPSSPPLQVLWDDGWRKRRLDEGEADDEYDSASAGSEKSRSDVVMEDVGEEGKDDEKRAAWLLMKLSVMDGKNPGEGFGVGHRGKRRRANSM